MWWMLLSIVVILAVLTMTAVNYVQLRDTHDRIVNFENDWKQSTLRDQNNRLSQSKQVEEQLAKVERKMDDRKHGESWMNQKIDEILTFIRVKHMPKHVVNYAPFERLCIQASLDPNVFQTFRGTPEVMDMLEHVPEYQGPDFLRVIQVLADDSKIEVPWPTIQMNDHVGSPKICTYVWKDETLSICPTTLRYVMLALHSLIQMKNAYQEEPVSVIEIGAGYGGQCAMIFKLAPLFGVKIQSYTILDLDGPRALQKTFLARQLTQSQQDIVQYLHVHNQLLRQLLKPKSFLFSAYAYSEIHRDVQKEYNRNLKGFVAHGRIVWNSVEDPERGFYDMLGLEPWQILTQPEFPQTASQNVVYVF